jgi:hypothetical protein
MLWKLALAIALAGAIIISASARAPRSSLPRADLRRLLLGALALYIVAVIAVLKQHGQLAILLFAAGIVTSALAFWLSRGRDDGGPRREDEPVDEHPPPGSGDLGGTFDWPRFERELLAYIERSRDLVHSS